MNGSSEKSFYIVIFIITVALLGSTFTSAQSLSKDEVLMREILFEHDAAKKVTKGQELLAILGLRTKKFDILDNLVIAAIDAGKLDLAEEWAKDLMQFSQDFIELSPSNRDYWNYGNMIYAGNIALGRIALRREDLDQAKVRLLAAAGTPGSPQLASFGPNMSLAKELIERGEKETVLSFFEKCKHFWNNPKLEAWAGALKRGKTPDFGLNLRIY